MRSPIPGTSTSRPRTQTVHVHGVTGDLAGWALTLPPLSLIVSSVILGVQGRQLLFQLTACDSSLFWRP